MVGRTGDECWTYWYYLVTKLLVPMGLPRTLIPAPGMADIELELGAVPNIAV